MVFNSNKGFFLTLDDAAAPATSSCLNKRLQQPKTYRSRQLWSQPPSLRWFPSLQPPKLFKRPLQKPALHPALSPQPHSPQQKRSPLNWLQQRQPAQK